MTRLGKVRTNWRRLSKSVKDVMRTQLNNCIVSFLFCSIPASRDLRLSQKKTQDQLLASTREIVAMLDGLRRRIDNQ